ncbi:TonB-dependent receptor [Leptothrix cholodnii SP-6]|uniref:TonB-dependent receptor n=1 Tax=Leptothrix cholodnii (strain ATCC 51168 / LMG 8142 / SP-6) TaxID=395495 RepID=B1Y1M5_LEPCP|nr:TonB-dependent receptor [Leptothrix cholodnii]ACB35487.1 TonB-dependent receptor [Leptothrix cholodnii SP-6]
MHKHRVRPARAPKLNQIAALLTSSAFAVLLAGPVQAQGPVAAEDKAAEATQADAAKAEASAATGAAGAAVAGKRDKGDVVGLDRVVVTGTSQKKSKMRSSVSVTDVDQQQVADFGARSEADVLHLIPGIRAESSAGPGGNSNITVRGLPISSGGSKFVQLQEDGLPVVEFGDMNFGNNDYFIRFDNNVDSIQTLRGGSAATFASHAPGAVINYISKTGKEKGGSIGLTRGLNFDETRVDGDYGGKLSPNLRFHIGGYFRDGEGPRANDTHALRGHQIKGNLTNAFNGDKGYLRVSFKSLDESAPTYTSMPARASLSGNTVTGMSSINGFDIRKDSQLSIYNTSMPTIGPVGTSTGMADVSRGITVKSKTVGLEFHNELPTGFTIDNKFKISRTSSAFQTQFWGANTLGGMLGNFGAGSSAVYFNGPKAGQAVTDTNLQTGLVSQSAAINQQSPDMGHYANDLSLSKAFELSGNKLNTKLGYYRSNQDIVQEWQISERLMEIGRNGALIDVRDAAGAMLTTAGLTGYNNQWGGCCARSVNAHYTTDAPYLSLALESGPVDLEASLRHDMVRATGSYAGGKQVAGGLDVNRDGVIDGAERNVWLVDTSNPSPINYKVNYTSYSLGANYRLSNDTSTFARVSKGGRAIADRLLFSPFVNSVTGALMAGLEAQAVATVKQREIGVKHRGSRDWGSYGLFATLFTATVDEYDYDQTRTIGPKLNVVGTRARGLELESALSIGNFAINANAVYTDLKITKDLVGTAQGASTVGKVPGGVPTVLYSISPRYTFGPVTTGASIFGQTSVWNNTFNTTKVAGRYIVNAFVGYEMAENTTLTLNASNLFDKVASSGGVGGPNAQNIVELRPETGRSFTASIRHAF